MTCGMMTCETSDLEIEWSLCSALTLSSVADWAQSTNLLMSSQVAKNYTSGVIRKSPTLLASGTVPVMNVFVCRP